MSRLANRIRTVPVAAAAGYVKLVDKPLSDRMRIRVLAYHLTSAGTIVFESSPDGGGTKNHLTGALQAPLGLAGVPDAPLIAAPVKEELGATLSAATQGFITYTLSEAS